MMKSYKETETKYKDSNNYFDDIEQFDAKIKVFGVGGGGCNAVTNMVNNKIRGIETFVVNTDEQVLKCSPCERKIAIGKKLTNGLGAGANPEIGKNSAIEDKKQLEKELEDANMIFVTAGMGGGTGTGAAPVIAKMAKDKGILTVGVVTMPFKFEGRKRTRQAEEGLKELRESSDAVITIANENLLSVLGNVPLKDAFFEADKILCQSVQTITDLISVPSLINLDFADVKSILKDAGNALIGIGVDSSAVKATQQAVASPLLTSKIEGATKAIVNITGGSQMSLNDASLVTDYLCEVAHCDIDIILGMAYNERLDDKIIVTIIATGFEDSNNNVQETVKPITAPTPEPKKEELKLDILPTQSRQQMRQETYNAEPVRETYREPVREEPRDVYRDSQRDTYREPVREPYRESYRETAREVVEEEPLPAIFRREDRYGERHGEYKEVKLKPKYEPRADEAEMSSLRSKIEDTIAFMPIFKNKY